jgi:hypothetical protein
MLSWLWVPAFAGTTLLGMLHRPVKPGDDIGVSV